MVKAEATVVTKKEEDGKSIAQTVTEEGSKSIAQTVTSDYEHMKDEYIKRSEVVFDTDMKDIFAYSGGTVSEALQYKKRMQDLRQHLLIQALGIEAELKVVGDPSFTIEDTGGSKIFLKVTNVDGNLSIYTGLYIIHNVVYEISAGSFITTLSLMKDHGVEMIGALESGVFEKDKLVVQ